MSKKQLKNINPEQLRRKKEQLVDELSQVNTVLKQIEIEVQCHNLENYVGKYFITDGSYGPTLYYRVDKVMPNASLRGVVISGDVNELNCEYLEFSESAFHCEITKEHFEKIFRNYLETFGSVFAEEISSNMSTLMNAMKRTKNKLKRAKELNNDHKVKR